MLDLTSTINNQFRMQKYLYVYILKCNDNTYYTGITNNPEKRIKEHNEGFNNNSYTFFRRPVILMYCELFIDYSLAIRWENKIKKWSRLKKEGLINNDWQKLKYYSKSKNKRTI